MPRSLSKITYSSLGKKVEKSTEMKQTTEADSLQKEGSESIKRERTIKLETTPNPHPQKHQSLTQSQVKKAELLRNNKNSNKTKEKLRNPGTSKNPREAKKTKSKKSRQIQEIHEIKENKKTPTKL